jgi:uncharacterized protein (TIGR02646 family)
VKTSVCTAQYGKCAFCESKVVHIAYGDVEHYRPKGGYQQSPEGPLVQPGYYWLAYEWSNLFFCCQICNQRHKRNLFPLNDSNQRAKSHRYNFEIEQPWFIDPATEDPSALLEFHEDYIHSIDGNIRTTATIDALCLNRVELAELRRDFLEPIKALIDCRKLLAKQVAKVPQPELLDQLDAINVQLLQCATDSA